MGKLVSFSEFDKYFAELKSQPGFCPGTILDTNIIVSLLYEIKFNHDEVVEFLDRKIHQNEIICFTNVVTTAEFINIYRRILLTEHLADAVDEASKLKLSKESKYLIKRLYGEYKHRYEYEKKDLIFSESDIKKIKGSFSGGPHSGLSTWPELSKLFLGDKLQSAYEAYEGVGIKYISPNSDDQKEYFHSEMKWEDAIKISSTSSLAMFDSMILNALSCSKFSFAISTDADLAYATLSDPTIKDVVTPDSLVDEIKKYRFKTPSLQ